MGIFFSDERAEFIDFDEGADFGLWWAGWECLGSLDQPARDRLVMNTENPADCSHPHPFEIELTGLLLEGGIFQTMGPWKILYEMRTFMLRGCSPNTKRRNHSTWQSLRQQTFRMGSGSMLKLLGNF